MATLSEQQGRQTRASLPNGGTASSRRWVRFSGRTFYLFISPWLVGFLLLTVIPLIYAFVISFTNFDGVTSRWRWIGFANYQLLLSDPDTWYSLGQTLLYMAFSVPLSVIGGLGLALLINQRLKAVGLFRTLFYLPSVVPVVAAAIIWRLTFDRDAGALNAIIGAIGGSAITWLIDPTVFYAMIIMVLWGMGGGMIIFLAGLQGIPSELQEAAVVDGATSWQSFFKITLPLLSPVLFFQIITGAIYSLQTFIQPLLLSQTGGGLSSIASVPRSNFLYMVNVYQQFLYHQRFGYGSAMLWILFVIILAITLLVFRSSAFWVYYEVEREGKE